MCVCVCVCVQHQFVGQTGLSRRLAVELLDKVNNPDNHQPFSEVDDDDLEVTPPPSWVMTRQNLFRLVAMLA